MEERQEATGKGRRFALEALRQRGGSEHLILDAYGECAQETLQILIVVVAGYLDPGFQRADVVLNPAFERRVRAKVTSSIARYLATKTAGCPVTKRDERLVYRLEEEYRRTQGERPWRRAALASAVSLTVDVRDDRRCPYPPDEAMFQETVDRLATMAPPSLARLALSLALLLGNRYNLNEFTDQRGRINTRAVARILGCSVTEVRTLLRIWERSHERHRGNDSGPASVSQGAPTTGGDLLTGSARAR